VDDRGIEAIDVKPLEAAFDGRLDLVGAEIDRAVVEPAKFGVDDDAVPVQRFEHLAEAFLAGSMAIIRRGIIKIDAVIERSPDHAFRFGFRYGLPP